MTAGWRRAGYCSGRPNNGIPTGPAGTLRQGVGYSDFGKVDIFLHEGLIADAIATVQQYPSYDLLARVIGAAVGQRPEWVIQTARAGRTTGAGGDVLLDGVD